jgi:hypothetical protein
MPPGADAEHFDKIKYAYPALPSLLRNSGKSADNFKTE